MQLFEKKTVTFYTKITTFMVGKKIKKMSIILTISAIFTIARKNIPKNEILVFFDPVGPLDARFEKNRFFKTFSCYSKVRGTQK